MSSEINPTLIQEFKETIIEYYISYATLSLLIYDLVVSFELEIKYFWRRRISAVALLYFMTRYGAILITVLQLLSNTFNANNDICRTEYFSDVFSAIIMLCVDFMRVQALYARGKAISIVLFTAFGIEAIAGLALTIRIVWVEDSEAIGIAPGSSLCFVKDLSDVEGSISWSIPLAYGALLLVLALYKAAIIWKENARLRGVSLVKVLIRDQALYYLAMIFVCFANIVAGVLELSSLLRNVLDVAGNPIFLSILGARLLFNMKEAGEKGLNQGTSCLTASSVNEIDFATLPDGAVESSLGETAGAEEVERTVEAEIEEVV